MNDIKEVSIVGSAKKKKTNWGHYSYMKIYLRYIK